MLGLARHPDFAASAGFIRWNWLGILDLVVALGLGASMAMAAPGTIGTAPMATLPLLLVPIFLVPLFLMLHATALMQSRRVVRDQGARQAMKDHVPLSDP
jgi:membrane protein implicated in regulation of membrane protease activity